MNLQQKVLARMHSSLTGFSLLFFVDLLNHLFAGHGSHEEAVT